MSTRDEWHVKNFGRRGTVREALALCACSFDCARIRRDDAAAIEELNTRVWHTGAEIHLGRAAKAMRKKMREHSRDAMARALRVQLLIAAGAPLT
jgi:hypothetical protein